MKLELMQYGDHRGVGCVVKQTTAFGRVSTWTVNPKHADRTFKEWICIENGKAKFASANGEYLENFYAANFWTKNKSGIYFLSNPIQSADDIPESLIMRGNVK